MTFVLPRQLIIALMVLLALIIAAWSVDARAGHAAFSATAHAQLGPGVREAFNTSPSVGVIVALRQPAPDRHAG